MVQNLVNTLVGQQVFVEGVGFIGTTKDIELPSVKFKQVEVNGHNVDSGLLEPMEAKIEVAEYNPILWEAVRKRSHEMATFVIKKSVRDRTKKLGIYVEIGGWVTEQGFPGKISETDSITLTINVQTYRLEVDGKEMYNIDIPNYICKINGVDEYEELRKHIM